jgi:hypothetical protein
LLGGGWSTITCGTDVAERAGGLAVVADAGLVAGAPGGGVPPPSGGDGVGGLKYWTTVPPSPTAHMSVSSITATP